MPEARGRRNADLLKIRYTPATAGYAYLALRVRCLVARAPCVRVSPCVIADPPKAESREALKPDRRGSYRECIQAVAVVLAVAESTDDP
jgi:hypothetical protein